MLLPLAQAIHDDEGRDAQEHSDSDEREFFGHVFYFT